MTAESVELGRVGERRPKGRTCEVERRFDEPRVVEPAWTVGEGVRLQSQDAAPSGGCPADGSEDRGSATVLVAASVAVLLVVAMFAIELGAAAVARRTAESAADAAALAAATLVLEGQEIACSAARELAAANGAHLEECAVVNLDVLVRTSVSAGLLGRRAVARARAGPVDQLFTGADS